MPSSRKMYACMFWNSVQDYQQIKHFHLHVLQFILRGRQLNAPESRQPTIACANKMIWGKTTEKWCAGAADKGVLIGILIGTRRIFSDTCFLLSLGTRNHVKVKPVTLNDSKEASVTLSHVPSRCHRLRSYLTLAGGTSWRKGKLEGEN